MNFCGVHKHTLDAKNRLSIPAPFRAGLGESFVVFSIPGNDKCLFCLSQDGWADFIAKSRDKTDDVMTRKLQRRLAAGGLMAALDKQGRITLTQEQVDKAFLKKDVLIVGIDNRVEIWDPELFQADVDEVEDSDFDDYGLALG